MTLFGDLRHPWLGVEIRHLATLEAISRTGSFRGAADELGYVQSAVSQQVSRLERQLGTRLIDRSRGRPGVALTAAGEVAGRHADATLGQLGAAAADLRAATADGPTPLRVGVPESLVDQMLPQVLAVSSSALGDGDDGRHGPDPGIHVRETGARQELLSLVERGVVDAAVVDVPLPPGPFAHQGLSQYPCALVVAASSPMARRGSAPDLADIAAFPLIVDPAWPLFDDLDTALRATGAQPRFTHSASRARVQQALAASGVGAAVMSRLTVDHGDPRTTAIDLDGTLPAHTIALAWHSARRDPGTLDRLSDLAAALTARLAEQPPARQSSPAPPLAPVAGNV